MNSTVIKAFSPVVLVALLSGGYFLVFGWYPRFFDIQWDEEVQLHDGRVTVIHVKQTYERRGARRSLYENTTFRRNEFTIAGGAGIEPIFFGSRLGISYIDQIDGIWYVVLFGQGPYGNHPDEMPDRWGQDFTTQEERLARLENGRFVPTVWENAPSNSILHDNLVVGSMSVAVLASFDGKTMTLNDKKRLRENYPPGPGGGQISRPIRFQKNRERINDNAS